ncbi:aurora kinase A and ninein-interacting protein [Clarias gariepinus]|uniref:aurora kinase A and ninein-interacting protein n=1 Tax=Clarias gariepinus TaxID=13013 RepID=UPI00234D70A9|nr:aurora kinase A and ninein-interacting protein [Clarias gariepinus]
MKMSRGKSKICKGKAVEEEECGVWLDAAELRAKKQKKPVQPITKLLNPLARSGGYSVAVALNFTQTRMEMPATKQSMISSFFLPQSKKGKGAEDCSSLRPSGMSSTPLSEAHTAAKRKREMRFELPEELDDNSGHSTLTDSVEDNADVDGASGEGGNDDDDDDDDKEQQFLHLIWGYQSEECEPAGKRRPPSMENVTDGQKDSSRAITSGSTNADEPKEIPQIQLHGDQAWQKDLQHRSICTENRDETTAEDVNTQGLLKHQSLTEKNASFLNSRSSYKTFYKDPELFERRHQGSPLKRDDKENSRPTSPRHSTALSPFKQRAWSSPVKHSSGFNKKLHRTPKKTICEDQENDEDPFSMLFTQDSEGFRVIAHRSKGPRCPLKDRSNSREGREYFSCTSVMPLETEENSDPDPEMLFTQDSQGNMVIKH